MKRLLTIFMLLWLPAVFAADYTYEELLDEIDEDAPMRVRTELGIIRQIDLVERSLVISGYEYVVGPSYGENAVEVSLYNTSAGSFELLTVGMKVEIIYVDFGLARAGFVINELGPDVEVEH